MSLAHITLGGVSDWSTLFDSKGVTEKLTSSTSYTIKTRMGASLTLSGRGFAGDNLFGYSLLASGEITGFSLSYRNKVVAKGAGYAISAGSFDEAAIIYALEGAKSALFDLFLSKDKTISGGARVIETSLDGLARYAPVASITVTSGHVRIGTQAYASDRKVADKIGAGFTVADTASALTPVLRQIAHDARVTAIDIAGKSGRTFTMSAAMARVDAKAFFKIDSSYVLDVRKANGASTTTGHGDGLTIHDVAGYDAINGRGHRETFVFSQRFGDATLVDFGRHMSGPSHDSVHIARREIASFATLLQEARQVGNAVVVNAVDGDRLTIDGTTIAAIAKSASDFRFF